MPNPEWELTAWSNREAQFRVTVDPSSLMGTVSPFGPALVIPYDVVEPADGAALDPVLVSLGGYLHADGTGGASVGGLVISQ